jgi:uncharacterized delta-60 repeat protein
MRGLIHRTLPVAVALLAFVAVALPGAAVAAPGDLDPTFGSGGKVTTDFGGSDGASAVTIQSDGRIVATGSSGGADFALARYNADGSLDASFGGGGRVTTDFGSSDAASALAIQSDGKIVVAGRGGGGDFALARYNADGSLDASFGSGGRVTTNFGGFDSALGVALQADGRIVAAGGGGPGSDFALARYDAGGSLDTSFGSGGTVTTNVTAFEAATAVAVQADGKIVTTGSTFSSGFQQFALVRYNADGSLDSGFGAGGIVTTDFGLGSGFGGALVVQSDGRIVAAGRAGTDLLVARYNADGSPDASFGSGGKVTTDFGGTLFDAAFGVAVQSNGKILAAGTPFGGPSPDFALARYNADGSLDATFGSAGKVTTDFGGFDVAFGVQLQADGKIVAAGQGGPGADFALARYEGEPTAIAVSVDVKPGSSRNPVELSSNGVVPVAILTTDGFDATTVDPSSVCFGDAENPVERDCTEAHGTGHVEDVNGDGRPDLLLHYETTETGIDPGDTTACLSGRTFAGVTAEGCDSITTI